MNTIFFSNFSARPRTSQPRSWDIPPKSLFSLDLRDIPNFLAPTPSHGRPLPHRKISRLVIFLFPYSPPPHPDKSPARPTPKSLISAHFGSVSVRFGSVSGPLGGVGERRFCKGKEYHYNNVIRQALLI